MPNSCEFVVGRLLEIRVADGYKSVADVNAMIAAIGRSVGQLPAQERMAIVADWRAVTVMSPETAIRAREMLAGVNPRVIRSAILTLPENPTTNLQVIRLIREAENPERCHFTDPGMLADWLSRVLTREETTRMKTFLALH